MATPVEHKQDRSVQAGNITYQFEHEALSSQQEAENTVKDLTALFKESLNLKESSNFVVKCRVDTDENDASIVLNVFESKPSGKLIQKDSVIIAKKNGAWATSEKTNSLCRQVEQIHNKTKNSTRTEPNLVETIHAGLKQFNQIREDYEKAIKNLKNKILACQQILKDQKNEISKLQKEKSQLTNFIESLKTENNHLKPQIKQLEKRNKTLEDRNSATISAVEFRIGLDSLHGE